MRSDQIDRVKAFFRDNPELGEVGVWVFGSWAPGRPHWEGILALAVLLDPARYPTREHRAATRATLQPELSELVDEPLLDLIVLNDAPPLTARKILDEGRRLLAPPGEIEHALVRDVNLQAADIEIFLTRFRRARATTAAR